MRRVGLARLFETVNTAVDVLLPVTRSVAAEVRLAVLEKIPSIVVVVVMVIVARPLLVSGPKSQVTVPLAWSQVPWLLCADTKTRLSGNTSVTTTFEAVVGPRFVTESA